jgi:hypothetical protein
MEMFTKVQKIDGVEILAVERVEQAVDCWRGR